MKKITLLGGSNSIKKNGLFKSLSEKSILDNYALGASTSLQNLYEIIRHKKDIDNSDIIISESNVNDFHNYNVLKYDFTIIERNIRLLYSELSKFNSKVLILILPLQTSKFNNADEINEIHLDCANIYGFNVINFHQYYIDNGLNYFYYFNNLDHPLNWIMYKLGDVIVELSDELISTKVNIGFDSLEYAIISEFDKEKRKKENSLLCESVVDINSEVYINKKFNGYKLLGIHCWSDKLSSVSISNERFKICKPVNSECQFHEVQKNIEIIKGTIISNKLYLPYVEPSIRVNQKELTSENNISLISLFICKGDIVKLNQVNDKIGLNDISRVLNYIVDARNLIDEYQRTKRSMKKWRKWLSNNKDKKIISYILHLYRGLINNG